MSMALAVCPSLERVIAITHDISRRLVPRERFAQLLRRPRRRRMARHRHVHDATPFVREEDEHQQ